MDVRKRSHRKTQKLDCIVTETAQKMMLTIAKESIGILGRCTRCREITLAANLIVNARFHILDVIDKGCVKKGTAQFQLEEKQCMRHREHCFGGANVKMS